jgi:hypothetical protein
MHQLKIKVEVFEESGFTRKDQGWLPRQAVSEEHVALAI